MPSSTHPHASDVCIPFDSLVEAVLVARVNRFRAQIRVGGKETSAYLANPGRLEELMVAGSPVWVRPAQRPGRKTPYDLILTQYAGTLVSMNSHLPNQILQAALVEHALPWFEHYNTIRTEVPLGQSRLDFRLSDRCGEICWLEAKSVTLVTHGVARFPDAPTERGRRHLGELVRAIENGDRAAVVFVVQRADAQQFAPHDKTDPAFGDALRAAADAGVEIRAVRCTVTQEHICLDRPIAVSLDGDTAYRYNLCRS